MKKCKKLFIPICLLVLFGMISTKAQYDINCGTAELHDYNIKTDPDYAKRYTETEANVYKRAVEYYKNQKLNKTIAGYEKSVYTIPVVVHVVHDPADAIGEGSNVTDQRIIDAIQDLSDKFSPFYGNSINTGIEFCLASVDTAGNPTTGITRLASAEYTIACMTQQVEMKRSRHWDSFSYLNIWIVDHIFMRSNNDPTADCDLSPSGYATPPAVHGSYADGIVIVDHTLESTTLTHEAGHYFNLKHTFDYDGVACTNNNCLNDGDCVCDTPPQTLKFAQCNHIISTCSTDVNPNDSNNPFTTNQFDMLENYMVWNGCPDRFTEGQKVRMLDALFNPRASLLTSLGCCKSGLNLSGIVYKNRDYEASDSIISTERLPYYNQVNVSYDAGEYILLNPGFNSRSIGNVLYAFIDGCGDNDEAIAKTSNNNFTENSLTNTSISCYPNPFNNSTMINFNLDESSNVSLKVFDASGREIARLIDNEQKEAGNFQVNFDGSELTSGIYFYTLHTNTNSITKKMILHK